MPNTIFTVGHSVHPIETFIALLSRHSITAIADVRSSPYSRFTPQFNREALSVKLKAAGISYVFLGRELGARSDDKSCYIGGKVQYDLLARTPLFHMGIRRVSEGAETHKISLLCAEKDPLTCHRTILISRHLASKGFGVKHILDDGRLESHEDALLRLLRELNISDHDLFRAREELHSEAYAKRARQIAFVENEQPDGPPIRIQQ